MLHMSFVASSPAKLIVGVASVAEARTAGGLPLRLRLLRLRTVAFCRDGQEQYLRGPGKRGPRPRSPRLHRQSDRRTQGGRAEVRHGFGPPVGHGIVRVAPSPLVHGRKFRDPRTLASRDDDVACRQLWPPTAAPTPCCCQNL